MENNLAEAEHSRKDENTNAEDLLLQPPTANVDDDTKAKSEDIVEETKEAEDAADIEEEPKEKKEEEAVAEVPPETPPPSLEKLFEDMDGFIATLQNNDNADATLGIPDFIDRFIDLVEEKIESYEKGKSKWGEVKEEDSSLLEAIDRISNLMKTMNESSSQFDKEEINIAIKDILMNRIGAIHQKAMSYLEDEFRLLMDEPSSRNKSESEPVGKHDHKGKHVAEPPPSDSEPAAESVIDFPGYGEETISNLINLAMKMISGGYQSECCQVYFFSRKHAFEEGLHKLGLEKTSIDEVHKMQWEALEREIPIWINTFKECATVYFPSERKLAETVFIENPTVAATLFVDLSRSVVIRLLNFAEAVAMTKRAGEKLFKLLDMYETLRDLIPHLDNLFPEECVGEFKAETMSAKCKLGETAILIFCELENSVKSDTGKTPVAGGAVHPLTRYIMNYLRLACEYKDTLEEVFKEHSKIERSDSTGRPHYDSENKNEQHRENDKDNVSPFAAQLMRVMELLDSNLEGKAKLYKEVALSNIFMMNNGRYIVQKIKGSAEIYEVMGETWCRKRSSNLRTYHKNYQIETWSKILGCLSPKGLNDNGKVHKPVLKERFKTFNALFEEIHKTQSTWVVSDEQLQSELRVSISALVIPAYRSFLGRFSQYLDPGRQTEKYIKYQAEDIETYIEELFDGNPHHQAVAKKKA